MLSVFFVCAWDTNDSCPKANVDWLPKSERPDVGDGSPGWVLWIVSLVRRWAGTSAGRSQHNPTDPCDRRASVERQGRQDDTHPRVEQARHRAEDARNADLMRLRRVETVRPRSESQ